MTSLKDVIRAQDEKIVFMTAELRRQHQQIERQREVIERLTDLLSQGSGERRVTP